VKDGKPPYCYNWFALERFKIYGDAPLPPGEHQVRMEFAYDGGGVGKGGDVTLYVDGKQVGSGRVKGTHALLFSADETAGVGSDTATARSARTARDPRRREIPNGANRERERRERRRRDPCCNREPDLTDGGP